MSNFDWDDVYVTKSADLKEIIISFVGALDDGYGSTYSVIIPPTGDFPECDGTPEQPAYCLRLPPERGVS